MTVALPTAVRMYATRQFTRVINEPIKYASLQGIGSYSVQKGPTDFLFNVTLTLQNVADGSRWRVEKASDGSALGGGVQSGTGDINLSIGYAGSPLTVRIKVRKASGSPIYKPFETNAIVGVDGASAYILQTLDE